MTAGFNLLGRIWSFTDYTDDVGGAMPSGTVIYEGVQARVQNSPNSLDLNIQGYETSKFFSGVVHQRPDMNLIEKKHYFEVQSPPNHRYYQKMFRIESIQEPNFHPADPRRYLVINFKRVDTSKAEAYQ